ncbi:hypothetical protein AB0926_33140 [Streptomyces griseoincarnatus]|uniref:hypothetical protein n=1 Tax=Streptomyces sp. NPDC013172 TaxID=3155009 RepID=UPI0033D24938
MRGHRGRLRPQPLGADGLGDRRDDFDDEAGAAREQALQQIEAGHADAVGGPGLIANPDLVERWQGGHPENEPRPAARTRSCGHAWSGERRARACGPRQAGKRAESPSTR